MSPRNILFSAATALCLFATLSNCSDDDGNANYYDELNPKYKLAVQQEPAWVGLKIVGYEFSGTVVIDKGIYEGETIYIFSTCCAYCSSIALFYNKKGQPVEIRSFNYISNQTPVYRDIACEQMIAK